MWPDPERTDELLAGARSGDARAVNRLLQRHRDAVLRLVHLRLDPRIQGRVDPSDIVQEVFVEANRRLKEYLRHPTMPFHLWLRHIAKDRIIDAHRRHRVSARRSVDRERRLVIPSASDGSSADWAAQLCDGQLTPAAAATQQELARRVEQAITRLADQDAEIILMRHFEQLSNQEVA